MRLYLFLQKKQKKDTAVIGAKLVRIVFIKRGIKVWRFKGSDRQRFKGAKTHFVTLCVFSL
ncbi:hypothetical protein OA88_05440 [Flavobacterium sp. JRM]|nr:hypothetical protein OA88_05440 [Flavobacterium sp. JRM]